MKTSNRPRPCDHDRDTELRDQATRASKGCFLQLCEGLPNDGVAMRRKYFVEANDSLHETVGAIDLAATLGMMSIDQANGIHSCGPTQGEAGDDGHAIRVRLPRGAADDCDLDRRGRLHRLAARDAQCAGVPAGDVNTRCERSDQSSAEIGERPG